MSDHTIVPKTPQSRTDSDSREKSGRTPEVTLGDLQSQFQNITSEVGELARLVRGGARGAVAAAVDRAGDARSDARERAEELEQRVADWVRERPIEATLVSMGVGAILWSILKRS